MFQAFRNLPAVEVTPEETDALLALTDDLCPLFPREDCERAIDRTWRESYVPPFLPAVKLVAVDALAPQPATGAEAVEVFPKEEAPEGSTSLTNPSPQPIPEPKEYLDGWQSILVALGMKNNEAERRKVSRTNKEMGGPIIVPGRGSQPKVDRARLIEWWNGLEMRWQALDNQTQGARLEAEAQHNYGREGVVVPGIGGQVKKRRKDFKP
jgi:hypothetical protein